MAQAAAAAVDTAVNVPSIVEESDGMSLGVSFRNESGRTEI